MKLTDVAQLLLRVNIFVMDANGDL